MFTISIGFLLICFGLLIIRGIITGFPLYTEGYVLLIVYIASSIIDTNNDYSIYTITGFTMFLLLLHIINRKKIMLLNISVASVAKICEEVIEGAKVEFLSDYKNERIGVATITFDNNIIEISKCNGSKRACLDFKNVKDNILAKKINKDIASYIKINKSNKFGINAVDGAMHLVLGLFFVFVSIGSILMK